MDNLSLALSVSDGTPLFLEEENAPMGNGFPVQAPPEPVVPSTGEGWKGTVADQTGAPEASRSLERGEILRRLLAPVLTESDTGRAADKLLARFGTLGAILSADATQLGDVVGKAAIDHLRITYLALQRALREQIADRPIIGSWSALEEYAALRTPTQLR